MDWPVTIQPAAVVVSVSPNVRLLHVVLALSVTVESTVMFRVLKSVSSVPSGAVPPQFPPVAHAPLASPAFRAPQVLRAAWETSGARRRNAKLVATVKTI